MDAHTRMDSAVTSVCQPRPIIPVCVPMAGIAQITHVPEVSALSTNMDQYFLLLRTFTYYDEK